MTLEELEKLIELHGTSIYGFCCHLTGDRLMAEDLYQDTLLKAFELRNRIQTADEPAMRLLKERNYCFGIAIRLYKNLQRRFCRYETQSLDDPESGLGDTLWNSLSPEEILERRTERLRVRAAIDKLPLKQRTVIYLFYYAELSIEEIGNLLKLPEGTVKSRLSRGKENLEKLLRT